MPGGRRPRRRLRPGVRGHRPLAHGVGLTASGVASTSWPFLAGAAVGWAAVRAWRGPFEVVPTGVGVWLSCVALGMVLRVVAGQGTAAAFVVVALAFLGTGLLGWRLSVRVALRHRGPVGGPSAARR